MDKELLNKLISEAGITGNNLSDGNMSQTELEKFAQLIVREAASCATWFQDMKEEDVGLALLEHFGLEEIAEGEVGQ